MTKRFVREENEPAQTPPPTGPLQAFFQLYVDGAARDPRTGSAPRSPVHDCRNLDDATYSTCWRRPEHKQERLPLEQRQQALTQ